MQTAMENKEEEVEIDPRRLPIDQDLATYDPTEHCSPPTKHILRLVDEITGLTLDEVAELGSVIMKKRGMNKPLVVGVMKPGVAGMFGMAMKAIATTREET